MDPAVVVDDSIDWRTQFQADSRERIINKITETMERHLPYSVPYSGEEELKMIAKRFEEKICNIATSMPDYLKKIAFKMLAMKTKYQNTTLNSMVSNSVCNTGNPPDPGFISSSSRGSSTNDDNITVRQEAVNQESSELRTTLDCFFKVMIGNFDKELSIPPKYCRIFNHWTTTNQRIILRNGSRSWIVHVNNNVMRGGWEEFVKDHRIKQGELLVFNHAERKIYDVKIFSCSGCGNRYPWSSDNREKTTTNIITTVQEGGNASR